MNSFSARVVAGQGNRVPEGLAALFLGCGAAFMVVHQPHGALIGIALVLFLWASSTSPILALILGMVAIAAPYAWSPSASSIVVPPALGVCGVLGGVGALRLLVALKPLKPLALDYLVVAYVLMPGMSAFAQGRSFSLFASTLVNVGVPYFGARLYLASIGRDRAARFTHVLVAVGVIVALLGVFEFVTHTNLAAHGPVDSQLSQWAREYSRGGAVRIQSTFGQPIALGGYLLIPLGLAFLLQGRGRWVLVPLGVAELLSFSRGPYLAAVLLVIILTLVVAGRGRRVLVLLALITALALAATFVGPVHSVIRESLNPTSLEAQNATYRGSVLRASFSHVTLLGNPLPQAQAAYLLPGLGDVASHIAITVLRVGALGLMIWIAIGVASIVAFLKGTQLRQRSVQVLAAIAVAQWVALITVSLITNYQHFYWIALAYLASELGYLGRIRTEPASAGSGRARARPA